MPMPLQCCHKCIRSLQLERWNHLVCRTIWMWIGQYQGKGVGGHYSVCGILNFKLIEIYIIQTITKSKVNWDRYDPDNHKI
jgi:hypothetical protein